MSESPLAVEFVKAPLATEAVVVALERLLPGKEPVAFAAEAELVAILEALEKSPLVVEAVAKPVALPLPLPVNSLTVVVTTTVAVALVTVVLSITVTAKQGGHEPEAFSKNSSAKIHNKTPAQMHHATSTR